MDVQAGMAKVADESNEVKGFVPNRLLFRQVGLKLAVGVAVTFQVHVDKEGYPIVRYVRARMV